MNISQRCVDQIAEVKKQIDEGRDKSKHKTIFHQLLDPNAAEGHVVPNVEDLTDEMFTILTAAAETTGHTMTMTTYYALSNSVIHQTLVVELKTAFPNKKANLDYLTLEKLPYLTAVIKEGLRLSYGAVGRLPRVIETDDAIFSGNCVPKGTTVGMSSWMMHRNPENYPDPEKFDPERWTDPKVSQKLDNKYFVPFSRGSRQCVGMQYVPSLPFSFCTSPFAMKRHINFPDADLDLVSRIWSSTSRLEPSFETLKTFVFTHRTLVIKISNLMITSGCGFLQTSTSLV